MDLEFNNGSRLFIRSAFHSADSCRGISAQLLLIDEFQDIAAGDLPVLQEVLSHAANGRIILTGTPKHIDNHLEQVYRSSTANEWMIRCTACGNDVMLDLKALGPISPICFSCATPVDPGQGRWVPRNPDATWGDGYWINHLMVPWIDYADVLERQRDYDFARFRNEVLGLSSTTGDFVVSREELEACCLPTAMAKTVADVGNASRSSLLAGIDWGGGGRSRTVLVIGYMSNDNKFIIVRFERFAPAEDPALIVEAIAQRCRQFQIRWLAADREGTGSVYNRLLYDALCGQLRGIYAIHYSSTDHAPRQEGVLTAWTVNRTGSIGVMMSRIKKKWLLFPRVEDCASYLDEFSCEMAEYDDFQRTVKYTHPESQQDDALHATNYALLIGVHLQHARLQHG